MEIFSPVSWSAITYSPGEEVASIFTRALARSRFGAASIQRVPSLSTFKMSNRGIIGQHAWSNVAYQTTLGHLCLPHNTHAFAGRSVRLSRAFFLPVIPTAAAGFFRSSAAEW